ncbi:hypothetical protein [Candidatus Bathycorpusculum sp.]|uniref:hypothetical protein n=1 Tax=Candidatus Bathycorpusculum sp. TaxID=2994959 RepID=UPI002838F188|nr:hypothetical protein [Candidatus Termitimicrobium sp.]MCL2432162.1 hypothetical protein [Candidatus Termitimicrobium sp.]
MLKDKIVGFTPGHPLVIDIIAKLTITFGVVLLISGLALMLSDSSLMSQAPLAESATESATEAISWVPGIPFNTKELTSFNITTTGLVTWIIGIDLVLIGLGIWVKHRLAHLAAVVTFGLATIFQVQQFFTRGIIGAPASIIGLAINGTITYFLFVTLNWTKHPTTNR